METGAANPAAWHLEAWDPPNESQAALLSRFLRDQAPDPGRVPPDKAAYAGWKLTHNAVRPGFATVALSEANECVSLCTVTPKRLWYRGGEVPWAEIGDTFTDARFQRRGLFTATVRGSRNRAKDAGFDLIYGLPNEQSRPGYLSKLDFAVHTGVSLERHSFPLSSRALASAGWFRDHPRLRSALSSAVGRKITSLPPRLLYRAVSSAHFATAEGTSFEREFDDLWLKVRATLDGAQVRDSRHLRWRFSENPFSFTTLKLLRDDVLSGYVIFTVVERPDLKHAIVVDWAYVGGRDAARAILTAVLRRATEIGADAISAVSNARGPLPLPFRRFGFRSAPLGLPFIVYRTDEGKKLLDDPLRLHFTLSDTDTF